MITTWQQHDQQIFSKQFGSVLTAFWQQCLSSSRKDTLHKKWSFPLRISSVNASKSAVFCGFGHIYWKNPLNKTYFFVQWHSYGTINSETEILCKTKREKFLQEFLIFYLWQTTEPPDDRKVLFIFAVKSISWIICWIFSEYESSSSKLYKEIVVLKTLTNFTGRHLW